MTKQYRLRITWSNGDSEYVGEAVKILRGIDIADWLPSTRTLNVNRIGDKWYYISNIRKVEFEEVVTYKETDGKF